jgi:hypothetical protein
MLLTFLSAVWHAKAFHGLGVQDVKSLILVDALFLLDRERRKGKKNKLLWGEEGFPGAGPALMSVLQVSAVRCN